MLQKYCYQLAFLAVLCKAQVYQQPIGYDPYNQYSQYNYNTNPTFSHLNTYSGYYTTPYPTYGNSVVNTGLYPGLSTGLATDNTKIRIWPYVIGQYLYPNYYNTNTNNPYASLGTTNWQSYYSNSNQPTLGKK